jgi:type IV secretion system protein VirB11
MLDALSDPKTVELILNADGKLWLERLGERMICIGKVAPSRAEAIIKAVAGYHNKEVTRASPVLEGPVGPKLRFWSSWRTRRERAGCC